MEEGRQIFYFEESGTAVKHTVHIPRWQNAECHSPVMDHPNSFGGRGAVEYGPKHSEVLKQVSHCAKFKIDWQNFRILNYWGSVLNEALLI